MVCRFDDQIQMTTHCNSRCRDATEKKCRCGCNGMNHGIGKNQFDLFEREYMRKVNFEVIQQNDEMVLLKDLGPWDKYLSITNGAEQVVASVAPWLNGRRLEYIDSTGNRDQILVKDGKFSGFAPIKN